MPRYRREDRTTPLYMSILSNFTTASTHRAISLPQHAFLVGLCLQTAVNYYLSKSDKH